MKTSLLSLFTSLAVVLLIAGIQGCYTQVGSTRDERVYVEDEAQGEAPVDADAGEGEYAENEMQPPADAGQDWTCQMRMGFDYYYPSTYWPSIGFSLVYNDPWYGWGYPWYSHGFPYYGYPYYGYPYYGGGYPYYPVDPWYGYPIYGYPIQPVPWQKREFGSTRGTGNTRGSRGVNASNGMREGINDPQMMDLPAASSRTVTGGTAAGTRGSSATADKPARTSGSSRKDITRKTNERVSKSQNAAKTSRDNQRLYRDRGSVSGSSGNRNSGSSPSVNSSAPQSGGASSSTGGTRSSGASQSPRSGGTSVRSAPPPSSSSAPRPSSPPPSSGGSRGGGGGRNPKP